MSENKAKPAASKSLPKAAPKPKQVAQLQAPVPKKNINMASYPSNETTAWQEMPIKRHQSAHPGALQEHMRKRVATSIPAPGRTRRKVNGITISGCELLGEVGAANAAVTAGQSMLLGVPAGVHLQPKRLGVRLPLIAEGYAEFYFHSARITVVPTVTQFNAPSGALAVAYNDDPDSAPPDLGADGIAAVSTWAKNSSFAGFPYRQVLTAELDTSCEKTLYVDSTGDARFDSQGEMYLLATQSDASFPTGGIGLAFVEYEVTLHEPNMPGRVSPTVEFICPGTTSAAAGPDFVAGAVFGGSTELLTMLSGITPTGPQFLLNSPPGIKKRYQLSAHYYAMTTAATIPVAPTLTIVGGSGWTQWDPLGAEEDFGSDPEAVSVRQLGNIHPDNRYGVATAFPTVNNSVGTTVWRFAVSDPVLLQLVGPHISVGGYRLEFTLTQLDENSQARDRPQGAFLTVNQDACLQFIAMDQIANVAVLRSLVKSLVDDVDAGRSTVNTIDLNYLNALHNAIGSPMPKLQKGTGPTATTAPMFLPLLAGAAAWFLSKFGPTIASSVLGYGAKKLEEYANGKDEKPTKRERRRARREEEEDEPPSV